MTDLVRRFANDESGATAIEYGLIAAGIGSHHHGRQHARLAAQGHVHEHLLAARHRRQVTGPARPTKSPGRIAGAFCFRCRQRLAVTASIEKAQ
jgi:hypothetical protein